MADAHAHHTAASSDKTNYSVSRILTGLAIGAGVVGAGITLAPHILPSLGMTSSNLAKEASLMIHNDPMGIAGGLSNLLGLVPGIGGELAEGGFFTASVSAGIGVGGVLLGQFIERREDNNKSIKWGGVIKYGAMITSALVSLPAILSSLSTGIIYLGMALNSADILTANATNALIATVSTTIGGIGGKFAHSMVGLDGITAVLPHFFSCGAPFAPAILSLFSKSTEFMTGPVLPDVVGAAPVETHAHHYKPVNGQLAPDDPNSHVTPEQKALVEAYNNAPAVKKPILQKWFRDQGYTPDFHADGTMHLFPHSTAMGRA